MSAIGASYRAVLALPHARRLFACAAIGRLSYGVLPLALFFVISGRFGSFGTAGLVMAAFNLTVVLCGPLRARIIDRYGRRRALPGLLTVYVTAISCLLIAVALHAPVPVLLVAAAIAGAGPPPLGPAMRGIWADLAPDSEHRQRAYSLDAVVEEVLFTVGPLLTGLAIAVATPWHAAVAGLLLLIVGTLAVVASPASTESPKVDTSEATSDTAKTTSDASIQPSGEAKRRRSVLRTPGFTAMLLSVAGVSVTLGMVEIAAPVTASRAGAEATAGLLLGLLSAGSALGGLLYGRHTWTRPLAVRLAGTAGLLAAMMALIAAAPALWLVGVGLAVAGLFVSPVLIIGYTLADELAPAAARTEATTWVNTAGNAGAAAGVALAGLLADHLSARVLYLIGAAVLIAVVAIPTRALIGVRPAAETA